MIVLFAFYFIVDKYVLIFEALSRRDRHCTQVIPAKKTIFSWEYHFGYKTQWPNSQSDKQDRDIDEQSEEMNALDMTVAKPEYSCLFHFIFVN